MVAALSNAPRRGARPLWLAMLAALAALLLAWPGGAEAQVTVSKTLCSGPAPTGPAPSCPPSASLSSVFLGQPVYYEVTINNSGSGAGAIDVQETFPPGFQLSSGACYQGITSLPASGPQVSNLGTGTWVCRFYGSYGSGSLTGANNVVKVVKTNTPNVLASNSHNAAINLLAPLPSDLKITKSVNLSSVNVSGGPTIVTYTITLENLGANDLVLGTLLEIQDRLHLKPSSVALYAKLLSANCTVVQLPANIGITPASDCLSNAPSQPNSALPRLLIGSTAPHDFATWRYPTGTPGLLKVGDKVVLTVQVEVDRVSGLNCVIAPNSDGFFQAAHIVLTLPAVGGAQATPIADLVSINNSADVPLGVITGATQIDPACNDPFKPKLKVLKTQIFPASTPPIIWGFPFVQYKLELQNVSTTHRIKNIQLRDLVEEAVGTPPFTATFLWHNCPATMCTAAGATSPQQLTGYGITQQVFSALLYGGGSLGMAPAPSTNTPTTASFLVRIRYTNPRCDSIKDGAVDPIHNHLRVLSWDEVDTSTNITTSVNLMLDHAVTTNMQEAPPCPLLVTKKALPKKPPLTVAPPTVQFGVPYSYAVTYRNPTTQTFTVGTLIDAMRFSPLPQTASPYAISLRVDYNYQCTPSGPINGHPTANPGSPGDDIAYIVANALPQQGVRLIQNAGPVTFGPNSKLDCKVVVTVSPPAPTDPYCSTAALDNSAILDMSAYYNANLPWPTTATLGMWAMVSKPLPACFNWIVNKSVSPGWTWQGGGPLSWTYSVYNAGPPIVTAGPEIHDFFSPPAAAGALNVSSSPVLCTNPSNVQVGCTSFWQTPVNTPPGGTSVLVPTTLGHQNTLHTTLNVNNAPPSVGPGSVICNNVFASPANLGADAYWKNPNTLTAQACLKILATGSIKITKVVTNNSGLPISLGYQYQITLSCTYPPDPVGVVIPTTSLGLAAGASATVPHIPVGSLCSVTEAPPPVPAPSHTCAFPVWQTNITPLSPFTTPSQANATVAVQVANKLVCRPVASLIIKKTTLPPPIPVPLPSTFQFNVSCTPLGPNTTVTVPANGQILIPNVPIVSTCTIVEQFPPPLSGCTLTATPNPIPPVSVTTPGTTTTVNVVNKLVCTGHLVIKKTTVTPPNVPSPATFTFNVSCTPGGPNTLVSVPANGLSSPVTVSAPGTCTVFEHVPVPPPGCTWSKTQVPPGNVAIAPGTSVVVTVTNKLVCAGPGTLVINKVTNDPAVSQPPFTFAVNCTPGGPNTTLTIASFSSGTIGNIPAPALCTIVEQPQVSPSGCPWVPTQSPPGAISVAPGATVPVTFTNKPECSTGTLVIKKVTIHPAAQTPFAFAVSCAPNGPTMTVLVPWNGLGTFGNIAAPATCTIVELPHAAPPGCAWVGTQSPAGQVTVAPGATVTVTYTNKLGCTPPTPTASRAPSTPPRSTPTPTLGLGVLQSGDRPGG